MFKSQSTTDVSVPSPPSVPKKGAGKKIVAIAAVVVIIVAVIGIYGYSYYAVGNALNESLSTAELSDFRVTDFSIFPPSVDFRVDFDIENPTNIPITIESMNIAIYIEDIHIGDLTAYDKYLPPNGRNTFSADFHLGTRQIISLISQAMQGGESTLTLSGEIEASGNYLFITLKHTYPINIKETIS